jgi:anti-sigma-K factor RskA
MTMISDAEIHTLAVPYALHALPDDEIALFERHLAACSSCRDELRDVRETVTRLGAAAEVTPPPELKERVLAEVATIRPLPPIVDDADERALELPPAWRRWWPRVALVAAAALAVVSVVQGIRLADVNDDLQQAQTIGAQMRELVAAPDMELVQVEDGDTRGTVMMARSADTAVLVADGMEPAPADHIYQLWFIGDDVRSAGLLGDTQEGRLGPFTATGLGGAGQLGVTIEPDGGSEQPTTEPVMVIDLPT